MDGPVAQRLAAQRLAAQRLAAQRLAAQRLAAQRLAAQRVWSSNLLKEQGVEEQGVEEQGVEEQEARGCSSSSAEGWAVCLLPGPLSSLSQQRLHVVGQQGVQIQLHGVDLHNLPTIRNHPLTTLHHVVDIEVRVPVKPELSLRGTFLQSLGGCPSVLHIALHPPQLCLPGASWGELNSSLVIIWLIIVIINSVFVIFPAVVIRGGPSVWAISPEERLKHDQKFDTLSPSMGFVSGEQARKFLLLSGLPASVLAQIWALADMNKDGKMDRLEFSIAMKLIKLRLQGTQLPSALPIIMKQPPVPAPPSTTAPQSCPTQPMVQNGFWVQHDARDKPCHVDPYLHGNSWTLTLDTNDRPRPLVPTATGLSPLIAPSSSRPLIPTMGNGTMGFLQPIPSGAMAAGLPRSASPYSSPLGLSSGLNTGSPLLDLGSNSSASSSPSVMSPMGPVPSDWAVPHASRLKYRQQFNSLDKQMIGYLIGEGCHGDHDADSDTAGFHLDGKLKAEEFILAMHLVDMAKYGQPLPLTLPTELVPPSQSELNMDYIDVCIYSIFDYVVVFQGSSEWIQLLSCRSRINSKPTWSERNAELEKRRQTLLEAERRERERRAQKEREEREMREREAQEAEERRKKEEERRLERQRELERQKEEERQREIERKEAAQRELERQRKEEWERRQRGELKIKKEQERDDIIRLKAKKKSLEMELEAVGNKQRQISDRLRDFHNKKKLQNTELDLTNQRKDTPAGH
ncbi:hypothetical protein F7725_026167 [Dissostichus mawsoni]|uniref:Uncharacterized protein n=1 Tax=Dissostichus mawsoni TaxID=36200 RepID=A0A7J5X6A0_DISMA|nr:hypothetical protein F7725_026167 [Dissostichus mawsoni]